MLIQAPYAFAAVVHLRVLLPAGHREDGGLRLTKFMNLAEEAMQSVNIHEAKTHLSRFVEITQRDDVGVHLGDDLFEHNGFGRKQCGREKQSG